MSVGQPRILDTRGRLSLAIYLRCFAAVEIMQDNRHRISMALTIARTGATQISIAVSIRANPMLRELPGARDAYSDQYRS